MKHLRHWTLVIAAIPMVACHRDVTAPVAFYHGLLQSDQDSYAATTIGSGPHAYLGFILIARYVNRSNAPIYIERCGGASQPSYGVQPIGDDSVPVGSTTEIPFACGAGPAVVVDPGTVRMDTFTVAAPSPLPASVRIFYLTHRTCNDMGACDALLPDSDRVSNPIQITAAP